MPAPGTDLSHVAYAAECFGLAFDDALPPAPADLPLPRPGEIHAVVGASGAGKTLALRAIRDATHARPLLGRQLDQPVLELFPPQMPSARVLRLLARVGLADARLWRLKARCLSAGERRRLEIALALREARTLVVDEIDAHLDAASARVIAANLARVATRERLRVVVSTHRPEVLPCLNPARVFEIRDSRAYELPAPPAVDLLGELRVVPGRAADYARFARWHYLGAGRPGPVSDVLLARFEGRPIGIAVFGYPHLLLKVRANALPWLAPGCVARGADALNAQVRLLSRVVVEPRFRGMGVAGALIAAGLQRADVPWVECIAQMGEFSDFLLRAGFARVGEIAPPPAAAWLGHWLRENNLPPAALHAPDLPPQVQRWLAQLARSRIQTGHGSRRGRAQGLDQKQLHRAIARLYARPAYFLWSRDVQR